MTIRVSVVSFLAASLKRLDMEYGECASLHDVYLKGIFSTQQGLLHWSTRFSLSCVPDLCPKACTVVLELAALIGGLPLAAGWLLPDMPSTVAVNSGRAAQSSQNQTTACLLVLSPASGPAVLPPAGP